MKYFLAALAILHLTSCKTTNSDSRLDTSFRTSESFSSIAEDIRYFTEAEDFGASYCLNDVCEEAFATTRKVEGLEAKQFKGGSLIKPMISYILFQLQKDGQLNLNDKVAKYFPQYSLWSNISILQLVSMQSGIPDYIESLPIVWNLYWSLGGEPRIFQPHELLEPVSKNALDFEPGSEMAYSNTNYILLGEILRKVTGLEHRELFEKFIFEPFDLKETYFDVGTKKFVNPSYVDLEFLGLPKVLSPILNIESEGGTLNVTDVFHPSFMGTAGALITTPKDMVKFHKILGSGQIGQDLVDFLTVSRKGMIQSYEVNYGRGYQLYKVKDYGIAQGHGGMAPGYQSMVGYINERDFGMSFYQNKLPILGPNIYMLLSEYLLENADHSRFREDERFSKFEDHNTELKFNGVVGDVELPYNSAVGIGSFERALTGKGYFGDRLEVEEVTWNQDRYYRITAYKLHPLVWKKKPEEGKKLQVFLRKSFLDKNGSSYIRLNSKERSNKDAAAFIVGQGSSCLEQSLFLDGDIAIQVDKQEIGEKLVLRGKISMKLRGETPFGARQEIKPNECVEY